MALIGTIGTAVVQTTSATVVVTTNTTLTVGSTIIGSLVAENGAGVNPALSVTDSSGNTYTIDRQVINGTTISLSIFSGRITTQLNSGSTVTISTSNGTRTRWAATLQAYDDIQASPVDQTASNAAASSSLSSGTTATTTTASELVYAAFGFGVRTFTAGSGYTASAQVATTAGSTDRALNSEWKYVSATGTQNATASLSSSSTYAGAIVTYKVAASNTPPTANAGPDQAVNFSATVTLDGSGSSDSDGTIASYSWSQVSGTTVTLSSTSVAQPTFTAPSSAATLVFSLTVTDNLGATSTADQVTITVADYVGYVAEAVSGVSTTTGFNFAMNFNKTVSSGHSILIGITVDAPPSADSSPVFTVTDSKSNTYTVDGVAYRASTVGVALVSGYISVPVTTSDTLTISCTTQRGRWAVSGAEFDNLIQGGLDETATNSDGSTALTTGATSSTIDQYEMVFATFGFGRGSSQTFSAGPHYTQAGTQQNTSAGSADRAVANEYRAFSTSLAHEATGNLSATSGYGAVIGTYHAQALTNSLPTADAGNPQTVDAFALTALDGTNSSDEDGLVTGYSWTQTSGPTVTLSSSTVAQPTFTAPGTDGGTSLVFSLNVTDNSSGASASPDTVTITVNTAEQFIAHNGAWEGLPDYAASSGTWS